MQSPTAHWNSDWFQWIKQFIFIRFLIHHSTLFITFWSVCHHNISSLSLTILNRTCLILLVYLQSYRIIYSYSFSSPSIDFDFFNLLFSCYYFVIIISIIHHPHMSSDSYNSHSWRCECYYISSIIFQNCEMDLQWKQSYFCAKNQKQRTILRILKNSNFLERSFLSRQIRLLPHEW